MPGLEIGACAIGKDAVADDEVRGVAEQVEVGKGALRLLDDHLLEVEDEADRALGLVGEELLHVIEAVEELLAGLEDRVVGHGHAHHPPEQRTGDAHRLPLDREDALEPPAARLGERKKADGLAGRRRVDHDDVVLPAVVVLGDPKERRELVHPR